MSKSPRSGSVAKVKKKASSSPKAESTSKAKQWEMVRTELEGKVASLQEELTGMRKWCLAALGEAEKRTAELRTQNAGLQRQVVDEAQRKADALHAAETNLQKLQEEKKLKLMVYGQTLTKHKEMAEEAEELQQALEEEASAREAAEGRLADAEAEKEHVQSQLAHLEREFQLQLTQHHETSAASASEFETEIQSMKETHAELEAKHASLEQEQASLVESKRALEVHAADVEASAHVKDHQLTDLRAAVERLTAQVDRQNEASRDAATDAHEMQLTLTKETEAQRHLSEKAKELSRQLESEGARSKAMEEKYDEACERLSAETSALRAETSKREVAEAEVKRLLPFAELPAKVIATEASMHELQIKLGGAEAELEVAKVNGSTWKEDHARGKAEWQQQRGDLEQALKVTTEQSEARIASLQNELHAEQQKAARMESETARLGEEAARLLEMRDKADSSVDSLTTQVQDLRKQLDVKSAEIDKFSSTVSLGPMISSFVLLGGTASVLL